jgi:hypothetical protein
MDDRALRELLAGTVTAEPPIGRLVSNALRAGLRRRRRRRATAAACSAIAVGVVAAVPALTGGHHAPRIPPAARLGAGEFAFVATINGSIPFYQGGHAVVPVSTVSGKVSAPISVPEVTGIATAPGGRMVYAITTRAGGELIPIRAATGTPLSPIRLGPLGLTNLSIIAFTPDGRTAYVTGSDGIVPVDLATGTARRLVGITGNASGIAIAPNGETAYVTGGNGDGNTRTVTPVSTATDTRLTPVTFPVASATVGSTYLDSIAITPDGKTAYVVAGVQEGRPYSNWVIPISTATDIAGKPIKLRQPGYAEKVVISPDGKTAYVLSSGAVTPISTATNTALAPISLPAAEGNAYDMVAAPDGRTLYVISPQGITAISTATRSARQIPIRGLGNPFGTHRDPIVVAPGGKTVYVGTTSGVAAISTVTNTVSRYITLSRVPIENEAFAITFAG